MASGSQSVARALLASIDDDALDELARRLAPRLATPPVSLFDVAAAARAAGVSPRTIRRAVEVGALPSRKVAGRWRIDPAALEAWAAEGGSTRPTPEHIATPLTRRRGNASRSVAAILHEA